MGIENERKLLLDVTRSAALIKHLRSCPDISWCDITQGYLDGGCRIRHVVPHRTNYHTEQFVFTFKTKVRGATVGLKTPQAGAAKG